jgi:ubiquinone/menaquinone biosynthesis C-methylase UbiE
MDYSEEYYKVFKNYRKSFGTPENSFIGSHMNRPEVTSYLNIGCGLGDDFFMLNDAALNARLNIGIDISSYATREAKKRIGDVHFVQSDAVRLPFKNGSFDFITAIHLIEHTSNSTTFLKEVDRVLCDKGKLILVTQNRNSILKKLPYTKRILSDSTHIKEFSKSEFVSLVGDHFEVLQFMKTAKIHNYGILNGLFNMFLHPDMLCLCKKNAT